mgnify:CR=1 FL=1
MANVYDNATDIITFARSSTATYLDSSGVIQSAAVDTPRIEYGSNGSLKGLLIEGQRTNLVTYSVNQPCVTCHGYRRVSTRWLNGDQATGRWDGGSVA